MNDEFQNHLRLLEALLFASEKPLSEKIIADRLPQDAEIQSLLGNLDEFYKDRGINLVKVGNAWAFRTAPDIGGQLIIEKEVTRKLSRAAVETLSIVAYHQPITRAEIEEVRGVSLSRGTLDVLLEAGWVRPRGRRRTPGRPVTWGTTERFLDHFGLEDLDDLPGLDDLKAAGLIDKRPAIQTLTTQGKISPKNSLDTSENVQNEETVFDESIERIEGEPFASENVN